MVWNTIAHPKMMRGQLVPGGGESQGIPGPRPLRFVDTAKQNFFDFIINSQVIKKYDPKTGEMQPTTAPVMVHGGYQVIYNKLMSSELVLGCIVACTRADEMGRPIDAIGINEASIIFKAKVLPDREYSPDGTEQKITVGGMPIIEIDLLSGNPIYLDCNNTIYISKEDITLDI